MTRQRHTSKTVWAGNFYQHEVEDGIICSAL
jgi:hypothetical protein